MRLTKFNPKNLLICAAVLLAFAFLARPTSAQKISNDGSPSVIVKQSVLNDCSKALDELAVYDKLLESKEAEIKLLKERLALEREKSELALRLAAARENQAASLTEAVNALREAVALKEQVIANKDKEIEILKKKKTGFLTILKSIAAGVAIGIALK